MWVFVLLSAFANGSFVAQNLLVSADRVESYLPLSTALGTYCQQQPDCSSNRHIRRVIEHLSDSLGQSCQANGDRQLKKV